MSTEPETGNYPHQSILQCRCCTRFETKDCKFKPPFGVGKNWTGCELFTKPFQESVDIDFKTDINQGDKL